MKSSKKGKLSAGFATSIIIGIVGFMVLMSAFSTIVPTAQSSGDSMNNSNRCVADGGYWNVTETPSGCYDAESSTTTYEYNSLPLSGLVGGGGVIFVIIMAGLVLLVVTKFMRKK